MNIISTTQELQSKSQNLQENEILLDVRTPEEFCQGHISGAVNLDISSPSIMQDIIKLDSTKIYIVYCRSGGRSQMASLLMEQRGLQVVNSKVGMLHWVKDGLSVTI